MKTSTHSTIKAVALAAAVTFGGISIAPAGLLISGGTNFGLYNDTGSLIQMYASDLHDARGVAVDPSGNSYVADYGDVTANATIRMYNSSGTFVRNVMTTAYYALRPSALAWNPAYPGLALTATGGGYLGGAMAVLDVAGTNLGLTFNNGIGNGYYGLAYVEKDGAGHVNDRLLTSANDVANTAGYYQWFDPGAAYQGNFAASPVSPGVLTGIAVKEVAGNEDLAFVADAYNGVVRQITNNGTITTLISSLNQPTDVEYSAALNTLFVASQGSGTVRQYDLSGAPIGSAFSVTGGATSLAYTAVPEPSTFAMLGLGVAGLALLRRRNSQRRS